MGWRPVSACQPARPAPDVDPMRIPRNGLDALAMFISVDKRTSCRTPAYRPGTGPERKRPAMFFRTWPAVRTRSDLLGLTAEAHEDPECHNHGAPGQAENDRKAVEVPLRHAGGPEAGTHAAAEHIR